MTDRDLANEVAHTARMLAAAGLVEAFGHVSSRLPDGGFLITPTSPLHEATAASIITVDDDGVVVDDPSSASPIEIPLHTAVYRARPDVVAICRGHGPSMVAWGVSLDDVPLLHGLGAIAGKVIPVHNDLDLISSPEAGGRAALTLSDNHAALLLANGGFAVGGSLLEAATRLWFTEERATVALAARTVEPPVGDWGHRLTHSRIELIRAEAWFSSRFTYLSSTTFQE
ncbi:MAG: class II aldolase/adducin family protein [Acidimicrobiales bacterium]